ncbi:MAG: enoyl-CoA hydratase/isomerase family protein [Paludibacterium sp.]|uniref:enoyl-CoA hydratase/isomerase family protein n=1 Tax=Paludibacterium sp. TaxID=1917523 RepID=UPI002601441E|nr:enoyl-CoA hydratase/isomerase family protein [Paludibacterium sp.]MBV8048839.1 enoyl-CoA hydratase/isomerase family protein [Paludibacterium sp.]MBV8646504.1 enoyl-CoA hydratase/isomerase family protein [Paludibacterium sp.]
MLDILPLQSSYHIAELRIAKPPAHFMDLETLRALRHAYEQAEAEGWQGLILSGVPGFFSSGIDLIPLLQSDVAAVHDYWHAVFDLACAMARSPIPTIAAITGHCLASGTLLALFADYRLMAQGNWGIGLNEVRAGVALPDCFQLPLRRAVGVRQAEQMLVFGRILTPQQALNIGLVDELAEPEALLDLAVQRLEALLALPAHSMRSTRAISRQDLSNVFTEVDALPVEDFVQAFLDAQTQTALRRVADEIVRKATRTGRAVNGP